MSLGQRIVSLEFLKSLDLYKHEKPYRLFVRPRDGLIAKETNVETEARLITVTDIREFRHNFKLDDHGFQPLSHQINFNAWTNKQVITNVLLKDVEKCLFDAIEGAYRVFVFGWRVLLPWEMRNPEDCIDSAH